MTYRVNAGRLPRSHWTHDPEIGGGRIVGEACHFVDTCAFLAGAPPVAAQALAVGGGSEPREDDVAALAALRGRVGRDRSSTPRSAIPSLPKERLEVLGEAGAGVLDDFRRLTLHRGGRETVREEQARQGPRRGARGASSRPAATGRQPWPVADMAAVTRTTFAIRDAVRAT